jgi:hypothetical protein
MAASKRGDRDYFVGGAGYAPLTAASLHALAGEF